jgi:hypothetical protein
MAHPPRLHMSQRVLANGSEDALQRALKEVGWEETGKPGHESVIRWVVWYSDTESRQFPALVPGQLVNRFPAMADCCRKALFAGLLARLRRMLPPQAPLNDGRLLPLQWALPKQRDELMAHISKRVADAKMTGAEAPTFIVKPDAGSKGDGIELTKEPCRKSSMSAYDKGKVVQEYIGVPLLIDGLKFDLRLYVLLTSVGSVDDGGPMRAFLHREGLVRFAVEPYDGARIDNVHAHLTNYALNKKTGKFVHSDEADGGSDGSKRTVSSVFAALHDAGVLRDVEALWRKIALLVGRSLSVLQPVLASARGAWAECPCFQLLGLDVLLDEQVEPWLIELNVHPSLRIDATRDGVDMMSAVDEAIKVPLVADTLRVAAALHRLPCKPREIPPPEPPQAMPWTFGTPQPRLPRSASSQAASSIPWSIRAYSPEAQDSTDESAPSPPPRYAYGTWFTEVEMAPEEVAHVHLFDRVRSVFDSHLPQTSPSRETGSWPTAHRRPYEAHALPGPRWKLQTFTRFLDDVGLLTMVAAPASQVPLSSQRTGASSRVRSEQASRERPQARAETPGAAGMREGLSSHEAEQIFLSICGKGGTMDVVDFAEACARVARRVLPTVASESADSSSAPMAVPAPQSDAEFIDMLMQRSFEWLGC